MKSSPGLSHVADTRFDPVCVYDTLCLMYNVYRALRLDIMHILKHFS